MKPETQTVSTFDKIKDVGNELSGVADIGRAMKVYFDDLVELAKAVREDESENKWEDAAQKELADRLPQVIATMRSFAGQLAHRADVLELLMPKEESSSNERPIQDIKKEKPEDRYESLEKSHAEFMVELENKRAVHTEKRDQLADKWRSIIMLVKDEYARLESEYKKTESMGAFQSKKVENLIGRFSNTVEDVVRDFREVDAGPYEERMKDQRYLGRHEHESLMRLLQKVHDSAYIVSHPGIAIDTGHSRRGTKQERWTA